MGGMARQVRSRRGSRNLPSVLLLVVPTYLSKVLLSSEYNACTSDLLHAVKRWWGSFLSVNCTSIVSLNASSLAYLVSLIVSDQLFLERSQEAHYNPSRTATTSLLIVLRSCSA